MSKRMRPSLKDYLRTGEVRLELTESVESPQIDSASEEPASIKAAETSSRKKDSGKKSAGGSADSKPSAPKKPSREKKAADAPPEKRSGRKEAPVSAETVSSELPKPANDIVEFLSLLAEADRKIWSPIVNAEIDLQVGETDFVAIREDFRTSDKNRFTFYLLDKIGEPLRILRTSIQIKDPMTLLMKWDEMGSLVIYRGNSFPDCR